MTIEDFFVKLLAQLLLNVTVWLINRIAGSDYAQEVGHGIQERAKQLGPEKALRSAIFSAFKAPMSAMQEFGAKPALDRFIEAVRILSVIMVCTVGYILTSAFGIKSQFIEIFVVGAVGIFMFFIYGVVFSMYRALYYAFIARWVERRPDGL